MLLIKKIDELYTVNKNFDIINNGFIIIEGNKITSIGKYKNLNMDESNFEKIIDASNSIAVPGFINCHTHAAMTLLRGYADDLPLDAWLQDKIWPLEEKLTKKDIYWGSLLAIIEMLKTGTTTFMDMYFNMDEVAKAVKKSGIRGVLSPGLIEDNNGGDLNKVEIFIEKWHNSAGNRIKTMVGPHAPYTCSPDFLQKIVDISRKKDVGINIHVAETKNELDIINNRYNTTPVKLLEKVGILKRPTLMAHCVHVNNEEIEIMKENNVGVAYNPLSNMKLGSGIAPVNKFLKNEIKVGIGTDGVASNNNLNMIEEARTGSYLQKVNNLDPVILNINKLLEILTINGAQILGLEFTGRLQKNYKADLVLIDIKNNSNFIPAHNQLSNLIYASDGSSVKTVIIDGKIIMRNRKIKTFDQKKVLSKVQERANRLTSSSE